MAVQVITDSTSDISPQIARQLNIRVVPIYVRFGEQVYRDGVDISNEEFYEKLTVSPFHPATSQPNPEDFSGFYSEHLKKADGIVSIHISSKVSGLYNSALLAKDKLGTSSPIEIIDSKFNSAGLGLVVLAAARMAKAGANLARVTDESYRAIKQTRMFGMFETMKYLARSGRVNKVIAATSQILNVMPLLTFHDGEIVRAGLVRTINRGMERIIDFAKSNLPISELTIVHSMIPEQANRLKKRLSEFLSEDKISLSNLGAGLGVHGGPGVLLIALRKAE